MATLDIIIIAIVLAAAIWGLFKGFISQAVSIVALVLGIWCACRFTGFLSSKVNGWFNLEIAQNTLHIILFAVILIVVVILAHFIGKGIESIVKLSLLGWVNRLLGLLFGALKAIVILGIAVSAINYLNSILNLIPQEVLNDSKGYGFLMHFTKEFFPFLHNLFS
jgi:membrane protein required for colicin V production